MTAAGLVPVYLSEHGVLAEGTLNWLVPVGMLGTMAVAAGLYIWWYVAAGRPRRTAAERGGPPAAAAVAEALADADREERRLRLARNAAPRLEYLRASSQATGWRPVIIAALITGPLIVGLGWFSVAMAPGPVHGRLGDLAAVAVRRRSWRWLMSCGSRRPRRGRRAIEQGLDGLAAYLGGRPPAIARGHGGLAEPVLGHAVQARRVPRRPAALRRGWDGGSDTRSWWTSSDLAVLAAAEGVAPAPGDSPARHLSGGHVLISAGRPGSLAGCTDRTGGPRWRCSGTARTAGSPSR